MSGAEPEISDPVLADGQDEISGEPIFAGVAGEFAVLIPAHSAAFGSNPKRSIMAREDTLGKVVHQTFPGGIDFHPGVPEPGQPASVGPNPEASFPVFVESLHLVMRQPVLFGVTGNFLIREPAQPAPGGNP